MKETTDEGLSIKYKNLIESDEIELKFKTKTKYEKINEKIISLLDQTFKIPLPLNIGNVKTENFIFTSNAAKKLKEIKFYLSHNYPVLLEGPTGTAKSKSVEILSEEMGFTLKRINLSSETKTADLFGRYAGDPKSFSGISFQEGVFIDAFKNGYILLLDEINLASNQVLQAIEECLDSHKISCEIPGMPWKEIEMGKGFNLIATQNPNKGLFANKRQELGKKFLSRFHVINFDSFQKEELYEIAKGLGARKRINLQILKELVDFHDEWSNLEERKNDILCFTIREIEATINAIANGNNAKDSILCIYGSRYKSNEYEKLKSTLSKYPSLNKDKNNSRFSFDNEFLFMNPTLEKLLKAVILAFDNNRHVMIIGDEGTGKTQIAKYIAEYRDKKNYINDDNGIIFCECTEDLKCSDLIGNQYPSFNNSEDNNSNSQQLMKWEDGFLTLAITSGKCCVLDNIEEAPATITERLNGLLDKKLNIEKDLIFEIPECPQKKEVKINEKFRLLCVCNYNSISKMSPAFLNRFDIVILEDQIKSISNFEHSEKYFLELIDTLMKQHSFNYQLNIKQNEKDGEKIKIFDNVNRFMDIDIEDLEDEKEIKKSEIIYKSDKNLNSLIYKKIEDFIKKGELSIYKLSLFCRAVYIFRQELDKNQEIDINRLVNYAFQLIISLEIEDDPIIENFIYEKYLNCETVSSTDNKFFFQNSPKLKSFMAKLLAASMINLHICVIGNTGVGKTSCAREFARIRTKKMKLNKDFYMHSFHSNTKSTHFYGNITMKNNQIGFINGSLLNAMEYGTTFIADEMNLSPEIIMKSLVPALDLNLNCKIYIPGIKKKIKISQNFFFISCQNDFTTAGRNSLPKLLSKKLKCIYYPQPPLEDIQNICSSINLGLYKSYDENTKKILIQNGENIAKYMNKLNKLKLPYISNWSIRDITKVLKRVKFQASEEKKYIYKNINFIDNIVFYTLSSIYKKELKDERTREKLLNNLLQILKEIFNLNQKELDDIKEIFNSEAEIVQEEKILKKGKCGISLDYIQFFNSKKTIFRLPSLYNELFQILLAHDEEPILIIGESGYKTYLAELILNIKPIQLNSETTISQLLGSTIFLSDSEAKVFYLKQIYNILDIQENHEEIKRVQNWVNYNESTLKEIEKQKQKINEKIDDAKYNQISQVKKFETTIDILKEKLFRNNSDNKKNLKDINLEFKPGLILNSIFSGKSLILKYLSNLPTVVLERFNELFSGKHNLTLNEDIHDTFTTEGFKEFTNIGEHFRIFATCSLGEQNKLSEAVLSRFTIICSDKYKPEEQKDVLKSFLIEKGLDFNQECIDEIIQFSKDIKNNSLSMMINALSLSNQKETFKENENLSRVNILSFILYRIYYGLSYKIKLNPDNQYFTIEQNLRTYLPKFIGEIISDADIDEEPLIIKEINKNKFIESKYNKLQIEYGIGKEIAFPELKHIAFTKTFTEMVDYIHLGIATNTPVIIEGGIGLGKQTAINYVAYKLNYRIINFIITQSTKIEDLLGKNKIEREDGQIKVEFCETKILKALIGEEGIERENNKIIIVFHNLNKASSALMESLCSIFDKKQKDILRPDGKSAKKINFNLIGIINSQSNVSIKDKLPLSLINSVFYYILPKLAPNEIKDIIIKKFRVFNLTDEAKDFVDCFNKSREFSYVKGNISYFSLNDISKYILFRKYTKDTLDKSIILQIIFAYRFIQNDFIKEIMNELGFLSMKINPVFKFQDDYFSMNFKNKDFKNELKLHYINKFSVDKNEVHKKVNTLNIKQKQCILFLILSILCKRACIIQGDTASGKTHLVRLLADMVGQTLIVYQINKETGLSIFTGQSTLSNDLDRDEKKDIIDYFQKLCEDKNLQDYLKQNFSFDSYSADISERNWSIRQFKNLIQKIREYIKENNQKLKEKYHEFEKIANELEELIQPYKRFKEQDSMFLKALEKGYWVLIDGIESANPVISDKLIRLCDENAELDLTETGKNIIYSNKNNESINNNIQNINESINNNINNIYESINNINNIYESVNNNIKKQKETIHKKIHKNFHLFINYNPLNKSNNNQLNEMFLNKCITFTLSPMDVDIENSAQIIYGHLKNANKINEILSQEISAKIAIIHQEMNKLAEENPDFFSGGVGFTGRIIKNIAEEISKSENDDELCQNLVNSFYLNYINSINNKNDTKNITIVKKIIKDNLSKICSFDTGEINIYVKYSEIFKILRNIQKVAKKMINSYDYEFKDLLELIKKVEIGELNFIYYHIDETLKMLDELVGASISKKIKYFNYFNLKIIQKLLKKILDYSQKNSKYNILDFNLNDEEELINKSILKKEIYQYNLVTKLAELKFEKYFVLLPNEILEFIDSINILLQTNELSSLYNNLKIINKFMIHDIDITQLFPFNQILLEKKDKNEKKIRMFKIILLIYKMIESKVNFEFGFESDTLKFDFKKEIDDAFNNVYIIINLTNDFYFIKSKILLKPENKKILFTLDEVNDEILKITNLFYIILTKILNNEIKITEKKKIAETVNELLKKEIRIINEITEDFEQEIKSYRRIYRIDNLISKYKEGSFLIMKIWFLILFYDEEKLKSITPFFCLPFEKELLWGIKNLYEYKDIDRKIISKIIIFTKKFLKNKNVNSTDVHYGDSNTFLYKIQAGFFDYLYIENEKNIKKNYCIQIENEINWYKTEFNSPLDKFWSVEKNIESLKNQLINLKEFVENIDLAEKYKSKLNDLITIVKNNLEENDRNKDKLIKILRNKLNNPTKAVYEACKENIDNFLKINKKNLNENQIKFPPLKSNNHYNGDEKFIICLEILKTYSKQHKKLSDIFNNKSKNKISDIYQLDKEIEIISDILGNYVLENGKFINIYEEKVMGIIRALIFWKIIRKANQHRESFEIWLTKFLQLTEVINAQTGGRANNKFFNNDLLNWSIYDPKTDLEDYLIIPKFEPKDFLYLFFISYFEEKDGRQILNPNKGFLFKGIPFNKNLDSILSNSLRSYDEEILKKEEKNEFQKYIQKIALSLLKSILPDKFNEFEELSYMDLANKLKIEREKLKNDCDDDKTKDEIIKAILYCFKLATTYEQNYNPKLKLIYEDIDFFTNKTWRNDLMANNPGMLYFLSKNYSEVYLSIMNKINSEECFIKEDNRISFWYFQIRVLSNIQVFEFDCYNKKIKMNNNHYYGRYDIDDDNELENSLKTIEEYIKNSITDLINKNKPTNINWINLVLDNIPSELKLTNKNLRHFYEFFGILFEDNAINYRKKNKNEVLIDYIIKAFKLIFNNQIDDFFKKSINSDDELIKLIQNPEEEFKKKIKEINQKEKKSNLEIKENIKNTKELLAKMKKSLPNLINNIDIIVKNKAEEYHKNYLIERDYKIKNENESLEKKLEKIKEDVQSCLEVIKSEELQEQKSLIKKINIFQNLMNKYNNYFELINKKETIYYKFTLNKILMPKYKYKLHIKNKKTKQNEKIEFDNNCKYIYLQSSIFDEDDIKMFKCFIQTDKPGIHTLNIDKDKIEIEKYSIFSFITPLSINKEEKERMIEDIKRKDFDIYEPKITFDGEKFDRKKLDNFLNFINKFDVNLLDDISKYNESLKTVIKKFIGNVDDLKNYLNLQTSGKRENDGELYQKVIELKDYLNKLRKNLEINKDNINNVISLNHEIENEKIFNISHKLNIVKYEEPKKNKPIYISNTAYLQQPMISDNSTQITFSSKSFQMFLGSYIPSIISDSFIIELLKLKEKNIKGTIKDSNSNIVTLEGNNSNENKLKILFNLQKLKSDEEYVRSDDIKFNLELSSELYSSTIIPFNLKVNIVPLSILFSLVDYKLKYNSELNEFMFVSPNLYANSKIQFLFKYLYVSKFPKQLNNNIVDFDCSFESLENNFSIIPTIQKEDNKLILIIPNNEDEQNNILNFILRIYFSSTFYINIKFNSKIHPVDFDFKWYSYTKEKFVNDKIKIYIDEQSLPYDYTLYFKINSYIHAKTEYQFSSFLPDEFKISDNFEEKKENNKFIFSIKLEINKFKRGIKKYYFKITGNGVDKTIDVSPKIMNKFTYSLDDLDDLPKYKYNNERERFIKENDTDSNSIYITPFNCYIPMAYKIYSEHDRNFYIPNYDKSHSFVFYCFSNISSKFKRIEPNNINDKEEFKILGIFNDEKWYPFMKFDIYKEDIFKYFKYLEYNDESHIEAKKMIEKINDNNNYLIFPLIIKLCLKKNNKDFIIQFLESLPKSLKKELNPEIEKIKQNNDENVLFIISNNVIYKLYNLLKDKYFEIIENDNILYLNNIILPKEMIEKEIKELRKEYFKEKGSEFKFNDDFLNNENNIEKEEEGFNKFLLEEFKNPKNNCAFEQIPLEEKEIEMVKNNDEKFDISDIPLDELKYPSENMTLNDISEYLNNCNKIVNILLIYIISASKSNNIENQKKAGNYFEILKSIYDKYNDGIDYSFFSEDINEFLKGFKNLKSELIKLGLKSGNAGILPRKEDSLNYIIFPKMKQIHKNKDIWKKENHKVIGYKPEEPQIGGEAKLSQYNNNLEYSRMIDDESEIEEDNKILDDAPNQKNKDIAEIKKLKILNIGDNYDDNTIFNEEEDKPIDDFIKKPLDNNINVGKITDKLVAIDPKNINEESFKEDDGIKRAIEILEEEKKKKALNEEPKFDLGNPKKSHKFKRNKKEISDINNNEKLDIYQLYTKSYFLSNQLFIKINGNSKVKYFNTLVVFLLDPSAYISEEIKILNMYILCAMTSALNCLEMKYSIVLMGDEEFRCVLKDHEEPHSIEALERVYECLMIKRFRTNIPGCLKFSLEEIKSNFKYTSFFVFTDGLDRRFIYTKHNTWDNNIFYKRSNSFAFIFLLSSILTKKNKEFLNEIWNSFTNETKCNSRIMIKSLERKIDEEFKNKISDIFVYNLIRAKNEEIVYENKYIEPVFKVNNINSISSFLKYCNLYLDDKSLYSLDVSYIKNEIISSSLNTNKEPPNVNYYKNNLHQIAKKVDNNKNESENNIINIAHKFLSIRGNLNRGTLEEIFKPNKANLKVLSNTGTEIDIMALILYFLNPVPDPMIYLQDAIGNVKEYAITVIIDTSYSVLNPKNILHSLNTIRVLLSSFTIIDLPSFDLIVTGENAPIVLCSEYPTFAALNEKSNIWELLFHCLSNPIHNADLLSALQAAFDLKRMRTNNFPSFLFVLTDGLFEEEKQIQLKDNIAKLIQNNMQVIGIGLGLYPYGINNIFGQAIFDANPINLLNSILNIIEGNNNDKAQMNFIQKEEESEKAINVTISKLIQNRTYHYKLLVEELKQSKLTRNCYDMQNDKVDGGYDEQGKPINPIGDTIGLLRGNSLAGQKILIVMLWSCALSKKEKELLDPKYIYQTNEYNSKCISSIVDYLGVKVKTVLNYEDAIKEITDKDKNGKCNYYTVWVMCGPNINQLPDKSKYPGLVEQFIDCLIKYWENGGGVVLFCDNDPLFFQANMFLEKVRFKGDIKSTKLRIEGNDDGCQILYEYEANGNFTDKKSVYDTTPINIPENVERMSLGWNVPSMYEGETISHSNSKNKEDILPFIPVAINSSEHYSILIKPTEGKEGDIIIDCGYTKAFINMNDGDIGTWRYIQNLAGFLARPEIHIMYDEDTAINYRPKGVNFKIDYYNLYTAFKENVGKGELDVVYMIDSTASMSGWIKGVKNKCIEISDKLKQNKKIEHYDMLFGGVFYRDPVDCIKDKHEYQPLDSAFELKTRMEKIKATGGGDLPEDWVGGYDFALNQINMGWRKNSIKIIFHIADAGAHTVRFTNGDFKHNKKEYEIGLINLIEKCAMKNINIFGYQIGKEPKKSFSECKKIYDNFKSRNSNIESSYEIYKFEHASDQEVAEKLSTNIIDQISAFLAKN